MGSAEDGRFPADAGCDALGIRGGAVGGDEPAERLSPALAIEGHAFRHRVGNRLSPRL